MGTIRERQRQLRQEAILDMAYQILVARGYEKMTMDEIATQVGIAKMTLYSHFPSKEILVIALIVQRMNGLASELAQIAGSPVPAFERLTLMLQHTLFHHTAKWEANIGIEQRLVLQDAAFQEADARLTKLWQAVVEDAKRAGTITPALSPIIIVHVLRRLYQLGFEELLAQHRVTADEIMVSVVTLITSGIHDPFASHTS